MRQVLARMLSTGYPASLRHILAQPPAAAATPPDAGIGPPIRLASYNIHKCVGTDGRHDPARIARVIAELAPDILALQEVDKRLGDRQGLLDLARIEAETGLVPVPVAGIRRAHGWHGNIILMRGAKVRDLSQITLPGLEPRGALVADLELDSGAALRVIAAHLGLLRHSRRRQAGILTGLMADAPHDTILMGDLNEWRIDPGAPLALDPLRGGHAPASFPSRMPLLPLDRIIASAPGSLRNIAVHRSAMSRIASDHLPITAEWHPTAAADR